MVCVGEEQFLPRLPMPFRKVNARIFDNFPKLFCISGSKVAGAVKLIFDISRLKTGFAQATKWISLSKLEAVVTYHTMLR